MQPRVLCAGNIETPGYPCYQLRTPMSCPVISYLSSYRQFAAPHTPGRDAHGVLPRNHPATHRHNVKQIDAKYYPHILDCIVDDLADIDPRKARSVCKAWCRRVDTANATWLAVDTCAPGIKEMPGNQYWEAGPEPYGWAIFAGRQPRVVYQRQSLWEEPATGYLREVQTVRDIALAPALLDILDPVDWVHDPIRLPPADTVRFQAERYRSVGLGCASMRPHARRIIFSDGPYGRSKARASPAHGREPAAAFMCSGESCGLQHTKRIVVNARTPVPDVARQPVELPPGLPELVVVFHGWRVVRRFDQPRPSTYHSGDPVNDVRCVVLAATKQGTRVTIVNDELRDFHTGEMRSNVTHVRSSLHHYLAVDR